MFRRLLSLSAGALALLAVTGIPGSFTGRAASVFTPGSSPN